MNGNSVKAYSLSADGDKKVALNFSVREFACNDGTDAIFISPKLVDILQQVRTHFGKRVTITSAYRTVAYNKKVDGAANSQHIYGTAADIQVADTAPSKVANFVETLLPNTGGLGRYPTFTHIDVREHKARW